jgi:hypothetical protein
MLFQQRIETTCSAVALAAMAALGIASTVSFAGRNPAMDFDDSPEHAAFRSDDG